MQNYDSIINNLIIRAVFVFLKLINNSKPITVYIKMVLFKIMGIITVMSRKINKIVRIMGKVRQLSLLKQYNRDNMIKYKMK